MLSDTSAPDRVAVFVERNVLVVAEQSADRTHMREAAVSGVDALSLLADSHRVMVVGSEPLPEMDCSIALEVAPAPSPLPVGSWLLTADPGVCSGERPAGVRTILVGPRRPADRRPTARCDIEARDLAAAVMEILARDAMA